MALSGNNPLMGKEESGNATAPERRYELRLYVAGQTPAVSGSFCQFEKNMRRTSKGQVFD